LTARLRPFRLARVHDLGVSAGLGGVFDRSNAQPAGERRMAAKQFVLHSLRNDNFAKEVSENAGLADGQQCCKRRGVGDDNHRAVSASTV
jgi:hypothetical protein